MKEFELPNRRSLTKTLTLLNKIFVVLNTNIKNRDSVLKKISSSAEKNPLEAWELLSEQVKYFTDQGHNMVDPTVLFDIYKLQAYIGKKTHGVMFCKDLVIGLKLDLKQNDPKNTISYRLDFDENKLLHINVELILEGVKYPFCIKIKFSTGVFGFSAKEEQLCLNDNEKNLALLELMKAKFWLKMTMGHTLVALQQQQPHIPNVAPKQEEQLLCFIQGKQEYSFQTVKEYIESCLFGKKGKDNLNKCNTELELLECIYKKPVIRKTLSRTLYNYFSQQDSSHRLFAGRHHVDDCDMKDDSYDRKSDSSSSVGTPRRCS